MPRINVQPENFELMSEEGGYVPKGECKSLVITRWNP
jgi:hypothetical protein